MSALPFIPQVMAALDPLLGKVFGDKAEKEKAAAELQMKLTMMELEHRKLEVSLQQGQIDTNIAQAKHKSFFVAGARPFLVWGIGVTLFLPVFNTEVVWFWDSIRLGIAQERPVHDTEHLYMILTGMLGLGGMRSFDKYRGVATDALGPPKEAKP